MLVTCRRDVGLVKSIICRISRTVNAVMSFAWKETTQRNSKTLPCESRAAVQEKLHADADEEFNTIGTEPEADSPNKKRTPVDEMKDAEMVYLDQTVITLCTDVYDVVSP